MNRKSSRNEGDFSGSLVVVDPGTVSGIVIVHGSDWKRVKGSKSRAVEFLRKGLAAGFVEALEVDARVLGIDGAVQHLCDICEREKASVTVHEDFILRTEDARRRTLDPVRISSAFCAVWTDRHFGGWGHLRFVYQQPADMKSQWDGPARTGPLAVAGLWIKGSTHKRDAMGHTALFLSKNS